MIYERLSRYIDLSGDGCYRKHNQIHLKNLEILFSFLYSDRDCQTDSLFTFWYNIISVKKCCRLFFPELFKRIFEVDRVFMWNKILTYISSHWSNVIKTNKQNNRMTHR